MLATKPLPWKVSAHTTLSGSPKVPDSKSSFIVDHFQPSSLLQLRHTSRLTNAVVTIGTAIILLYLTPVSFSSLHGAFPLNVVVLAPLYVVGLLVITAVLRLGYKTIVLWASVLLLMAYMGYIPFIFDLKNVTITNHWQLGSYQVATLMYLLTFAAAWSLTTNGIAAYFASKLNYGTQLRNCRG
ncbi:hypothetical protein [Tunicatimonas pelagia]|uniref:hypothetical protein n=1 Tax=Tunicatimonas pelagia TaxID=931531 RepID=UPI0026657785|nr:hypothetical protein [Tunicatimonas pelagia]WKN44728.1 hypothetical protein P0M28_07090 [Tunicatimonas pelagia]